MQHRISVIIPAYNYARFLGRAIDSVLAQTLPAWEVLVVDDGSTDETPALLAGYGNRITAIRKENGGVSRAANEGAHRATGDLLAFLDADDEWLPRKLELQAERFASKPDIGLVHCGVEEIDAEGNVIGRRFDGLEGWIANELLLMRSSILGGGSGAMVTREAFFAVGEFDARINVSQDWDLWYRIARNYQVAFVPSTLLRYRLHEGNAHLRVRTTEHDMLLAFSKAFHEARPGSPLWAIRRRCYGNLHTILAGSYFKTGDYRRFLSQAVKAVSLTPGSMVRFAGYPLRRMNRAGRPQSAATGAARYL